MHEYPITKQIIEMSEDMAEKNGSSCVTKITLVVGDYSGYIGDSIKLYFDLISSGTMCEGAELFIERIQPMLKCESCNELFLRNAFSFSCPKCNSQGLPTEVGREFYIKSIEVEGK